MNKLGLFCHVRIKSKRVQEYKNTKAKYNNIAIRDYNGINNDIYATDITYIPALIDVPDNHIFMSAIIHHKTKKIVSYNISKYNDTNLVMTHLKKTEFSNNFIIHSDHGILYSLKEYTQFIQSKNGTISMSRIDDSLDNREIEYFFSILKSEMFPNFEKMVRKLTFEQLKNEISKLIKKDF
ncbi:hypothetical protein V2P32_03580 [Mycoplasma sp. 06067-C1-B144P-99-0482-3]|uniref:hypothetical protein n=1 Tax=Mycoplasma sp. 06067-C1-B144P-99-0482-3 TaxID=3117438 RepID=UPI003DA3FDDE